MPSPELKLWSVVIEARQEQTVGVLAETAQDAEQIAREQIHDLEWLDLRYDTGTPIPWPKFASEDWLGSVPYLHPEAEKPPWWPEGIMLDDPLDCAEIIEAHNAYVREQEQTPGTPEYREALERNGQQRLL